MRSRNIALAAAALSVAWCGQAWADDAGEQALRQKLEEMQKQIDDLQKRVDDGSNHAGDELSARVDELEKLTKKDKNGIFGYWDSGIRMDSANNEFKLKMGGRIQSDWTWFQGVSDMQQDLKPGSTTKIQAGEEFRRARLYIGGTIYNNVDFSGEYDFAGGTAIPRSTFIAVKNLPFTATVGSFQEPTGTEELTSDLFIPFMERSSGNEAFSPDYRTGFMLSDTAMNNMMSWQVAMTRNSAANGNSTGNARSGDYNFTGRIAGQPWVTEDKQQYLTVGLAGSIRSPSSDVAQFSAHPELHIAPKFVDTGAFGANRTGLLEIDAGLVTGPFWAYADFFDATASLANGAGDVSFRAWSLSAGFFLTGEVKPYKAANSTYDRVKPKSNFDGKGGSGAWEIAARIDDLDLNDKSVSGGEVQNFTLGLDWILNPNTKIMMDFVHSKQKDLGDSINALEMRFQIDF